MIKIVGVTISLKQDLYLALATRANEEGKTVSKLISEMLEDVLDGRSILIDKELSDKLDYLAREKDKTILTLVNDLLKDKLKEL